MGLFSRRTPPPADPEELVAWMQRNFDSGRYNEVWSHRETLGLGFVQNGMTPRTWFWLNAYPALAALRAGVTWENPLGQPDRPPLVSTCAAYADDVHRGLGPAEAEANAEIARRFFA